MIRPALTLNDCLKDLKSSNYTLSIVLGKDKEDNSQFRDLKYIQSILITGSKESGKSHFVHSVVNALLLTTRPERVEFVFTSTFFLNFNPNSFSLT